MSLASGSKVVEPSSAFSIMGCDNNMRIRMIFERGFHFFQIAFDKCLIKSRFKLQTWIALTNLN